MLPELSQKTRQRQKQTKIQKSRNRKIKPTLSPYNTPPTVQEDLCTLNIQIRVIHISRLFLAAPCNCGSARGECSH